MNKGARLKFVCAALFFFFLLSLSPLLAKTENNPRGNLAGFIYERGGTTPFEGAVVILKNISTGNLHESSKSDSLGVFRIEGLESGIYAFGVMTPQGDFHSDGLLGIQGNETAKVSISLNSYEQEVASALQEVLKEQEKSGEAQVARVVKYVPESKEAELFIEKGLLQAGDRIHVKGNASDFHQEAQGLKVNGLSAKRVMAGQNCSLGVIKAVEAGDQVYVTRKRGLPPLITNPSGAALIIAGTTAIVYGIIKLVETESPRSAYKK